MDSIKLEPLIPEGRQRDSLGVFKAAAEDLAHAMRYAYQAHFPDLRDIAPAIMRTDADKIAEQVLCLSEILVHGKHFKMLASVRFIY